MGDEADETLLSTITYSDSVLFSCNCAKPSDIYPYQLDKLKQSSGHRLLEIFLCLRHDHLDNETLNVREAIVILIETRCHTLAPRRIEIASLVLKSNCEVNLHLRDQLHDVTNLDQSCLQGFAFAFAFPK